MNNPFPVLTVDCICGGSFSVTYTFLKKVTDLNRMRICGTLLPDKASTCQIGYPYKQLLAWIERTDHIIARDEPQMAMEMK